MQHEEYGGADARPNILNREDVIAFSQSLVRQRPAHVEHWIKSTLHTWIQGYEAKCVIQCVDKTVADSPVYKMLQKLIEPKNHGGEFSFRKVDVRALPEWARTVLAENRLWYWSKPVVDTEIKIEHWLDFLGTLPERQIKYTAPQLEVAAEAWDKALARQKLMSSLTEGVEVIKSDKLEKYLNGDLYVVKLLTKEAFAAEGAVMRNCVSGYYGRKSTEVYSLRCEGVDRPLATVEVSVVKDGSILVGKSVVIRKAKIKRCVVQVKGFGNKAPESEELIALSLWGEDNGIDVEVERLLSNKGHDYEEEDGNDGYDEEDGDDGYDGYDEEDEEEKDEDDEPVTKIRRATPTVLIDNNW